ncbi:hypothetical protein BGX29_003182 [Mortierella sp. GBA35]|nr:hypothetical protein BGX29_003182 [Mortierella sp. GBA35]
MAEIPHKTALSGKLLTMKFMQRQQEQETRDKLVKEQNRIVTEAHWVIDQAAVDLPKPYKSASQSAGEQQLERELKRQRQSEISDDEMAREMGRSSKAKKTKDATKLSNGGGQSKKPTTNRRAPPKPSSSSSGGGSGGGKFMKPKV